MMESSKEIEIMHKINEGMSILMRDLSSVVDDITELTQLLYNKEIEKLDKEIEQTNTNIKLHSHM